MPTPTISADDCIKELGSTTCQGCDGTKDRKKSHCRTCYFKLPRRIRVHLYDLVGSGYEEVYTESIILLRERNKLPARVIP